MMLPHSVEPATIIILAGALLAAVTFLRILAIHREHEIHHHDLVREARHLREEYNRKIKS